MSHFTLPHTIHTSFYISCTLLYPEEAAADGEYPLAYSGNPTDVFCCFAGHGRFGLHDAHCTKETAV